MRKIAGMAMTHWKHCTEWIASLYILVLLGACGTVPLESSDQPQVYAIPTTSPPRIQLLETDKGRGLSLINTFTGETVTLEWRWADASKNSPIGEIDERCAAQTASRIKDDPLMQHDGESVQSDPIVSLFVQCMESYGLQGELKEVALPPSFLFGMRYKNLEARYAATKNGVALTRFKKDVDSCAMPFLKGNRSPVQEYRYKTSPTGEQGWFYFDAPFKTIGPGSSALKQCMEQTGYAVEDRSIHQ